MAFTANTAFQPRCWNNLHNDLQIITGRYGTVSGTTFTPADCSAGFLCRRSGRIAEGVAKMVTATDGTTPIYFCSPDDVQRLSTGDNLYAVGPDTLGIGLPAGQNGAFTLAVEGETYALGAGNFSTVPTAELIYATVSNGRLSATDDEPEAGTGYYFKLSELIDTDTFTEGNFNAGARYNMVCMKTDPAAGE